MAEDSKAANQLVLRWLDFAIPNLSSEYPLELQLLISRLAAIISSEVSAVTCPSPSSVQTVLSTISRATLGRSSIRRPALSSNTFTPSSPTSPSFTPSNNPLERLLKTACLQPNVISSREVRPGWFRAKVNTEHGQRLYEYANSAKELSPEQVRLFLDDSLIKAKVTSAILLTNGSISGSQRIDLFGAAAMNDSELIPVIFLSKVPKETIRAEKLLRVADGILTFLMKTQCSDRARTE